MSSRCICILYAVMRVAFRYECLGLIAAVSCNTDIWRQLQNCVPEVLATLTTMLQTKYVHTKEYINSLTKILDSVPSFYEPHSQKVVDHMLAVARNCDLEASWRR